MCNLIYRIPFAIIAIVAMLSVPADSFAGETGNDGAIKKLLVGKSPWSVKWENFYVSGTFKISFAVADGGNLTGKLFDNSGGRRDKILKKIVTRKNRCVSFSSETGTKYDLCLEASGALKGDQDHTTDSGNTIMGTVVALPAKG